MDDYTSLLLDVSEYSGRDDTAHVFQRFVRLAEAKLNRILRLAEMEVMAPLALVNGEGALPADLLELRDVRAADGRQLNAWSLNGLSSSFLNCGGPAQGYAIVGSKLIGRPASTEGITLTYYGRIPPLSPEQPTNWLLTAAPDVYLYAILEEIAIWENNAEKVGNWQTLRMQAVSGLSNLDESRRWGNAQVVVSGPTP